MDDANGQDSPEEAQPTQADTDTEQPAPKGDSQGFIEPYLKDLNDPDIRGVVAERLEQLRKDSDSQANKKIAELSSQKKAYEEATGNLDTAKFLGQFYDWLRTEPVPAMQWMLDEYKAGGRDHVWEDLMTAMQPEDSQQPDSAVSPENKGDLRAELEAFIKEQLDGYRDEQAKEAESATELEAARERANTWLAEAAKRNHLDLNEGDRGYILQQASILIDSGEVDGGQAAIDMATEVLANRLKELSKKRPADALRVAIGGNGASPAAPDLSSAKDRKQAGLAMLQALNERD